MYLGRSVLMEQYIKVQASLLISSYTAHIAPVCLLKAFSMRGFVERNRKGRYELLFPKPATPSSGQLATGAAFVRWSGLASLWRNSSVSECIGHHIHFFGVGQCIGSLFSGAGERHRYRAVGLSHVRATVWRRTGCRPSRKESLL